jgi:hypothetical protein
MVVHRLGSVGVAAALVSVWSLAADASAADIASVLGEPDLMVDPFMTECAGGSEPGPNDDGIPECPIGWFGITEPDCMHRVDINALDYPDAVCSDGTPASFYVRQWTDPANEFRWVIHLQGGGGCVDEESCKARWCGTDPFYSAALMSNDLDGDGVSERPEEAWMLGISSNVPTNDFATWNHVFLPYCGSDLWLGRESDVDLGDFTVDAQGHEIIQSVRNMLRQLGPAWTSVNGYTMPLLDDAEEILFTGTSAGGYGALQNGDWFVQKFPNARSGLVIDGAMDVDSWTLSDFDVWETTTGWPYSSARLQVFIDRWAPGGYWNEIDAFIDKSCRDEYTPIDRLDTCMSSSNLLRLANNLGPFIETPTFVRMDLEDNVLSQWFVGDNPDDHEPTMGNGGSAPTLQDFTEMMRATVVDLHADAESDITVFAPRCGQHVGLEDGNAFASWTTPNTTDTIPQGISLFPATFRDAILAWFNPGGAFARRRWIDTDHVDGMGNPIHYSSCP